MTTRAQLFAYTGLEVGVDSLVGHYELDGRQFRETVTFEGVGDLTKPVVAAVASLWYLVAGLSYYKAGAAHRIDLASTPVGAHGRALLHASLHDGLGEFAYRNNLPLDDVIIEGGLDVEQHSPSLDSGRVLTPFGGGIDSVVSVTQLSDQVEQSLFVVSPASGRFASLEATAAVTRLPIVRAVRTLDSQITRGDPGLFQGHVPVTTMVTLLAAVAAVASGRGGVVMSNEYSSSIPNLRWRERDINHQWSKSWVAEGLMANAFEELLGSEFVAASYLRNRSELWVARVFSQQRDYHHVFRSCNRAFVQDHDRRAVTWCGECDKCLFINLMLAPFVPRAELRDIFSSEPLSSPAREAQLRTLIGVGLDHKPFECVGDPDESAVALTRVAALDEWRDVARLKELAQLASPERDFDELLTSQGPSRVPAHWLR